MRITKIIFGRTVQFRAERLSWDKSMPLHLLPSIEIHFLHGMGFDRNGKDKLLFPGFWNICFAWIKFEFTICINDKEDEETIIERQIEDAVSFLLKRKPK